MSRVKYISKVTHVKPNLSVLPKPNIFNKLPTLSVKPSSEWDKVTLIQYYSENVRVGMESNKIFIS